MVLKPRTRQEERDYPQPDWPTGTLRVDFESLCTLQINFVVVVRFAQSLGPLKVVLLTHYYIQRLLVNLLVWYKKVDVYTLNNFVSIPLKLKHFSNFTKQFSYGNP